MKLSTLSLVPAVALASSAFATVSSTLVADRYIVKDGAGASAKFYSVLDIYVQGNHLGDVFSAVTGLNGTAGHDVVFATSQAQGVTRDATTGKINGGTITSDIFKQAGGSSWNPTYGGSEAWDSFIANGNRKQNAKVTNRAGTLIDLKSTTWSTSTTFGGGQMNTANSNFIENGGGSGWFNTLGSNPYSSARTAENPFARLSLYNSSWNSTYTDLDRTGVLTSKGRMFSGATTATLATTAVATGAAGTSLDFCYMIGRFAIDVTGKSASEVITMQAQFNMVGKNGTSNEAGTTFTGATASAAAYKVSQFFQFQVPAPGAAALLSVAGLMGRRRKA
jgi:hypothetical protein